MVSSELYYTKEYGIAKLLCRRNQFFVKLKIRNTTMFIDSRNTRKVKENRCF